MAACHISTPDPELWNSLLLSSSSFSETAIARDSSCLMPHRLTRNLAKYGALAALQMKYNTGENLMKIENKYYKTKNTFSGHLISYILCYGINTNVLCGFLIGKRGNFKHRMKFSNYCLIFNQIIKLQFLLISLTTLISSMLIWHVHNFTYLCMGVPLL